jgi:hypothetical protein
MVQLAACESPNNKLRQTMLKAGSRFREAQRLRERRSGGSALSVFGLS